MTFSTFVIHLFVISLLFLAIGYGISHFQQEKLILWLYACGALSFDLFSLFIFFYAYNTSKSDLLFSFNNVVVASFLIKLLMSVGFLLAFKKVFQPSGSAHVFHYLFLYILYTGYEVYFLTKLGKADVVNQYHR